MRSLVIVAMALAINACSHSRMRVVMLDAAGPDASAVPVPVDSVFLFTEDDHVLPQHRPIARLSVGPKYSTNPTWTVPGVEKALREAAAGLGADAVVLGQVSDRPYADPDGVDTWGTATALRFIRSSSEPTATAARHTRELKAIVVAPLAIPEEISVPDWVAAIFAHDISDELRAAGLTVLPLGLYDSTSAAVSREGGEGSREQRTHRARVDQHGAQGFLHPWIEITRAEFVGKRARWDGATENVEKKRTAGEKLVAGVVDAIFSNDGTDFDEDRPPPRGRVQALTLVVEIENALGARVYRRRGGIELLQKVHFEASSRRDEDDEIEWKARERPAEEILTDTKRNRKAVHIALKKLR